MTTSEQHERYQQYVKNALAEVLERDAGELSLSATFADQGLDSLLGLRFAGKLGDVLGVEVELEWLMDYPSIAQLAHFLDGRVALQNPIS